MSRKRSAAFAALVFGLRARSRADAAEHAVPDDGELQVVLDAAAAGDTILIRPGTDAGSVHISLGDLVLIGMGGAEATRLDGGGTGRVLDIGPGVMVRGDLRLVESLFSGGFGYSGCGVVTAYPGGSSGAVEIRGCVFRDNRTWGEGGVVILSYGAFGSIRECTLALNDADDGDAILDTWEAPAVRVERNLIALSEGFGLATADATTRSCNDVRSNTDGEADPTLEPRSGQFSLDPRFCDPGNRDLTLQSNSPCLPGGHPSGTACGTIGRFGVGCVSTPIVSTGWSAIKAMLVR